MGNPDHVKWLQNGVDFWNARRRNKPFNPVLDNEDLTVLLGGSERWDVREISVHLQGINLSGANLRNSTLRDTDLADSSFFKADLHGTKLIGSRLDGSFFVDSNLQNSVLLSASLKNTRFWHCDLESAVLVNARLGNTEFFKCHMKDTRLYHNDLTAARFIGSRPWQARLLWEAGKSQLEPAKLEVDTIKGLDDLLTILRQLREAYDKQQVVLYFRGESRYFDRLEPSIMRKPGARPVPFTWTRIADVERPANQTTRCFQWTGLRISPMGHGTAPSAENPASRHYSEPSSGAFLRL